jgi:hypothetical protein
VTVPVNEAFSGLQASTWLWRGTFTGAGNGSVARLFEMGATNGFRLTQSGGNALQVVVNRATGAITINSTANFTNYSGTPLLAILSVDNVNGGALYRGLSGAVSAFGTNNGGSGDIATQTGNLAICNIPISTFNRQHPGGCTLFANIPSVLTSTQRASVTTLTGV